MNPTVSVIIPCFNQARFLPDCIASLQAQTYPHWEAIIVNDGSPDDTREVALKLREGEPRIRYIEQENCGLSGARNRGIEMARGEFIQFLDADDLILPNKLEAQISLFADQGDLAVAYSDFAFFNDGDTNEWVDSPSLFKAKYGTPDMLRSLLSGNFIVVHSALTRRTEIEKLGGFDLSLGACEDYDLWLRLASCGKKFAYCDGIHALYRQHTAGMASNRPRQIQHTISVLERVPNFLSINKVEVDIWNQYLATLHLDLISATHANQSGDRPRVSVCIPTFNGARYIKECLDSVLSQSMKDMEVIIVDDQSTDTTWGVLQGYSALYPEAHIRLFRNEENLGLVANWNRCIELARGQWIKYLFQDDLLDPSCIEKMLSLGERTGCPLVACRRDFLFEDVPQSTHDVYQRFTTDISMDAAMNGRIHLTPEQFCDAVLKFGSANNFVGEPSSTLIRHDVFQECGGFNPFLIQLCDLELWLRVGVNYGVAYVPETLTHFRVHACSTTSHNAAKRQFIKDVIDPLMLFRDFAVSANYGRLRNRASENGVNLASEYYDSLTAEFFRLKMGITVRSGQVSEDQEKLDALLSMYASAPIPLRVRASLGTKLVKAKLERLIDRHVTWRFRKN